MCGNLRQSRSESVLDGWQARSIVDREELLRKLESHYKSSGWTVQRASDGTLVAAGPGGVTWLGTAITPPDLTSEDLEERLCELAARRMDGGGELCPLDVIASEDCEPDLNATLERIGLAHRRHVSVYSVAA